ncbi:Rieske 2Fe-2S domain-containing protein [Thalassoglobus sp. JC818]|uniref:QcrA and Rieske domain-containing protein n=1 Tax=Thalassoglobus sp. JC818 TaxID=3232136 RepID=UPI00345B3AAA
MTETHSPDATEQANPPRRNFLVKFAAVLVGGVITAVPLVFGGGFFLNPLLKKKSSDEDSDGFTFIGSTNSLLPGGPPRSYKVTGAKQDAWTTYAETAIGAVYLKMDEDRSVTAFNASCPHLGCTVNYKTDANAFICPCHDSSFNLDGERSNEIPPRGLDTLNVEVRNDNEIWVKFENFRAGTAEKIPV